MIVFGSMYLYMHRKKVWKDTLQNIKGDFSPFLHIVCISKNNMLYMYSQGKKGELSLFLKVTHKE